MSTSCTPVSTGATPLTTAAQLRSIFSQPVQYTPATPPITPRYGSPQEAAQALMSVQRQQWSSFMGGLGGGSRIEKETQQSTLMQQERNILGQLRQMGYPTRITY